MPSIVGEAMALLHMVAAAAVGAYLGGAEATVSAAVAVAVAGLGSTVVMGRRLAAAMGRARAVAVVDWEVELQEDLERVWRGELEEAVVAAANAAAAAVRRQEMLRAIWEWEDARAVVREADRAARAERRRRWAERVAAGGG